MAIDSCTTHSLSLHSSIFLSTRITTRQADSLMDKRLVVAIDSWPSDSTHPCGHYVRTLGTIGEKDTETVRVFVFVCVCV